MQKALIFKHFLAAALIAAFARPARAEEFIHPDFGFKIEIPASMAPVKTGNKAVGLALKTAQLGAKYPTFNVISDARLLDPAKQTPERIAEEVINDYRLVGLLDAKLLTSAPAAHAPDGRVTVDIEYTLAGERLCSEVTIVPALGKSFILTFLSLCEPLPATRALSRGLRESFRALQPALPAPGAQSRDIAVPAAVLLIILALIAAAALRRRRLKP